MFIVSDIKVSVIVPIYNVEEYLPRCIDSLINQTLDSYEIILVNDGSPDQSQKIIDKYQKMYPDKIVGLIKENGGLSDARNYGIPYAKGEYISFLDSDDYVDCTFLEKMYNKAIDTQSQIVVCGYYGVNEINGTYRWLQKGNIDIYNQSVLECPSLIHLNAPYAWNKIYHRSLFEQTKFLFPKGWIWEDIPTIYPLLAKANKVSKIDEPLIYYVLKRKGSITATYSRKQLQLFQSLQLLNERFKELSLFDQLYDELLFINMRHIIFRFKEFHKYKDAKMKISFVTEGFKHLNKYFADWKNNPYYFTFYDVGKPVKQFFMKKKIYWFASILVPNTIHKICAKIKRTMKKARKIFSRNNRVKYSYAYHYKHSEIIENTVLFESFHGTTISDSPFYMMGELAKTHPEMKIYVTTQNYDTHKELLDKYQINASLVKLNTKEYAKILATCQYLVNNVSFPPYFIRRNGQKYINTWHGTPLKTLGKNMVEGIEDMSNMQRNFLHSTDLLFPNDFTMVHMMEDYNLFQPFTGRAVLCGYPRNTIFMNTQEAMKIREQFDLVGKEVFAYMPTWRGGQSSGAVNETYEKQLKDILNKIDNVLNDNQVFYVNLHSLVKDSIDISGYKHILSFPNIDNYEFLNCVDILISDYSSVFFDYSITKKPIVLFMYDYEEYMSNRGTYFDVRTLPFEKIYTIEDMLEYIQGKRKKVDQSQESQDYYDQFTQYDDIHATKLLNDYFFDGKNNNLQVYDYSSNKSIKHTLYFPSKCCERKDCKQLEEVKNMDNPIMFLLKNQFNYLLRKTLLDDYNNHVSYVVTNPNIPYTLFERMKLFISKIFSFVNIDSLMLRAFDNLLPHIQIQKIEYRENPNKFTRRLVNSYNRLSDRLNNKR